MTRPVDDDRPRVYLTSAADLCREVCDRCPDIDPPPSDAECRDAMHAIGCGRYENADVLAVCDELQRRYRAYHDGYSDGLKWDLDGFADRDAVARCDDWSTSTINAIGSDECARIWGVENGSEAFGRSCLDYDAGCHEGALVQQAERSGMPPKDGAAQ